MTGSESVRSKPTGGKRPAMDDRRVCEVGEDGYEFEHFGPSGDRDLSSRGRIDI